MKKSWNIRRGKLDHGAIASLGIRQGNIAAPLLVPKTTSPCGDKVKPGLKLVNQSVYAQGRQRSPLIVAIAIGSGCHLMILRMNFTAASEPELAIAG
ncbi:hypothetical protein [Halomicronema sp. CCY15110]|uniref:hypothetical protein n=1 Tax=Halomicronema sp. CCY15110 TaxID=2767773 RepID=UPI00195164DC|nr:hypothetical protein [Halomicronema sp. CCY15110]